MAELLGPFAGDFLYFFFGGGTAGCAGSGGRAEMGCAEWVVQSGENCDFPLYKPPWNPSPAPRACTPADFRASLRFSSAVATRHGGDSIQTRCPGRSERFPGWPRAHQIPGGELMINHGRDGGGDGRGQRGESPRIVLPAGTGSGQNLGMAQPGRDGSLEQLWG